MIIPVRVLHMQSVMAQAWGAARLLDFSRLCTTEAGCCRVKLTYLILCKPFGHRL